MLVQAGILSRLLAGITTWSRMYPCSRHDLQCSLRIAIARLIGALQVMIQFIDAPHNKGRMMPTLWLDAVVDSQLWQPT